MLNVKSSKALSALWHNGKHVTSDFTKASLLRYIQKFQLAWQAGGKGRATLACKTAKSPEVTIGVIQDALNCLSDGKACDCDGISPEELHPDGIEKLRKIEQIDTLRCMS
eukprot:Tbor_TRINITY_DN2085_c0_g1::TRINITY_DN2085_c0_g1_i1::g.12098::m.12098